MLIMKKDTNSIREIVEFETERTKYVLLNKQLEFSKKYSIQGKLPF